MGGLRVFIVNIRNGVDAGAVRVYHRGRSGTYPEKKEEEL
jgi:hypothetical protein